MIFFFLFFKSISEHVSDHIQVSQPFAVMSSFGFHSNATFHFQIQTNVESRLLLFMVTDGVARETRIMDIYQMCHSERKYLISEINKTDFLPSTKFEWNSRIIEKSIYYPIIINCISNHTQYDIKFEIVNNKYLIDYRNEKFSLMLLIFSGLNIFISIVWLVNTAYNQSFFIPIQFIFAILPSIRSFKCILHSYYWEQKKITEDPPKYINYLICVSSGFFYILILSTTSLVFSGWGIYKTRCPRSELLEVYFSSFILIFGLFSGLNSQILTVVLISLFLNMAGFLWYMKINTDYFVQFVKIVDLFASNHKMMKRIKLVRNFIISTFITLAITVIAFSCSAVEYTELVRISILEASILVLELVELFFFFLRKEYKGEMEEKRQHSLLEPTYLVCPNKRFLCFLQKVPTET